jgi:hypothetical protein
VVLGKNEHGRLWVLRGQHAHPLSELLGAGDGVVLYEGEREFSGHDFLDPELYLV